MKFHFKTKGKLKVFLLILCLTGAGFVSGCAKSFVIPEERAGRLVAAKNGMVSTQGETATRVGLAILEQGGNAVDAAVAIGFALAVTLPHAGNLGGGGFMLVHLAETGETVAIDYREKAPALAHKNMFLDDAGQVVEKRSLFSYLSVGVPGTVAGLTSAWERYGTIPLDKLMGPAIKLAEEGFPLKEYQVQSLTDSRELLQSRPEARKIFYKSDGALYREGELLVQKDLAWSLRQIAEHGASAFYEGSIAEKIAADMKANGGWISREDLKNYRIKIRKPVRGTYRGYEIFSMPPPSSGGVHIIQALNILEKFPIGKLGQNSASAIHLMAETMKLAYADRSLHLGDADYWPVPVSGLASKKYADELRSRIDLERAIPSSEILPGKPAPYESKNTTHFSIMDKFGNVVSNTYTINFPFGSGIVAKGTGILLNNEMDDFSAKPGTPNAYGLVGGEANAVEPGKRPLSSMSPTIVFKNGKPVLVTGSPGGSRIITTTLQIIMNVIDHGMDIAEATRAPRIHHQWLPDELRVESGLSKETLKELEALGHKVVEKEPMGSTQSIVRSESGFEGASDPRRPGALTLGY